MSQRLSFAALLVSLSLVPLSGFAATATVLSPTFTYQGRFYTPDGSLPMTDTVDLTLGIYSPDGICLLYEEKQTSIDLSTNPGLFSVKVGSLQGDTKRTVRDPGKTFASILANSTLALRANDIGTTATCIGGYIPNAGDARRMRVTIYSHGTGISETLSPDLSLSPVPQASVAETLQGLGPDEFIHASTNITQATLATLTSCAAGGACTAVAADASGLHHHDSLYTRSGASTPQNLGTGGTYTAGTVGAGTATAPTGVQLEVKAINSTTKGLTIQGAAGQAVNYLEIKDSSGNVLFAFDKDGKLSTSGQFSLVGGATIGYALGTTGPVNGLAVNGNVGIGTTGPTATLHVVSASSAVIEAESTAVSQIPRVRIKDFDNGDYSWEVGRSSLNGIGLYDNSALATRMFIDFAGNVAIGSTTPSERLSITGSESTTYVTASTGTSAPTGGSTIFLENTATAATGNAAYLKFRANAGDGNINRGYLGYISSAGGLSGNFVFGDRTAVGAYAERLRINSAGNVGIGTAAPGAPLHVFKSTTGDVAQYTSDGSPTVRINRTGLTGLKFTSVGGSSYSTIGATDGVESITIAHSSSGGASQGGVGIGLGGSVAVMAALHVKSRAANDEALIIQGSTAQTANLMEWQDSAGAKLGVISPTGNVGVGTTGPAFPLEVAGDVGAQSAFVFATGGGNNYRGNRLDYSSSALNIWASGSQAMKIGASAIGIGTTSAAARLHVVTGAVGATGLVIQGAASQTADLQQWQDSTGTVLGRVTASGNVGIGTVGPAGKLDVYDSSTSSIYNRTGGAGANWLTSAASSQIGTYTNHPFYIKTNDTTAMIVLGSGNVGIGTTGPSYKLQVGNAADGTEARANAWNTLSDERLKRDFSAIEDPLDKILQIGGYTYYWKDSPDKARKMGVKAQEVERVFPEVVSTGSDGFKSVSYNHLIAPVIEAIKSLAVKWSSDHAELERVKRENDLLRKQFDGLKQRSDAIEAWACSHGKTQSKMQDRRPAFCQ